MPRDLPPSDWIPPGEDTLDVPTTLGWFVAACSVIRNALVATGDTLGPPSLRRLVILSEAKEA